MRKLLRGWTLASLGLVLASTVWAAEGTGRISGFVQDANHNAVGGMVVKVTDVVDPARVFSGVADKSGRFDIANVPSGSYLVSADTLNSSWIQKDDSPIVEVSGTSSPEVRLVLVRVAEMATSTSNDSGMSSLEIASIAIGSLAVVGTVISIVKINDLEDDNDALQDQNKLLSGQINQNSQDIAALNNQIVSLESQLNQLQKDLAAVGGQNEALQKQIAILQRDLQRLRDEVEKAFASNFK